MSKIDPPAGWPDIDGIDTFERLLGGTLPTSTINRSIGNLTSRTKFLRDQLTVLTAPTGTGASSVYWTQSGAGATPRTVASKLESIVAPEDFGALGDGTTDDTIALQAALERAGGGTLYLTAGKVYRITAALKFRSNTTIMGYGATLLRGAAIDNMLRNVQTGPGSWDSTHHVEILGVKFDANFANFATPSNTSLAFAHARHITIRDCEFTETPIFHMIEINSSRDVTIDSCRFTGGNTQALQGNEAIQLDYSYAGGYPWEGPYDDTACLGIRIINCVFDNTGTPIGTHSHKAGVVHSAIQIESCQFYSPYYVGIRAENWANLIVKGCYFSGGVVGVLAWAFDSMILSDFVVEGNFFINQGNNGFPYTDCRAVRFLGQTDGTAYFQRIVIANNVARDLNATGTRIATHAYGVDYCQHVTITGNASQSTRGAGIYCYGSQWVTVTGNTVRASNTSATSTWAGIIITAAAAAGTLRGTVTGNTVDTFRMTNADRFLVRGNNVTAAGGLVNSGNTNVSVGDNLVDTTAA